jgi:hypothetical protein
MFVAAFSRVLFVLLGFLLGYVPAPTRAANPVFPGWYADPEVVTYGTNFWIFPTYSAPYNEQVFFDAFSSPDLIHWQKHSRILSTNEVRWARRAMWAPAAIQHNGKYFVFFGANDIQNDKEHGGIGVAIADGPQGPYRDYLGKPLIDRFQNGAQPIDQFVFRDADGQHYLIYGGWRHCNIAQLKDDFTGFEPFHDATVFKEITPAGYVEGPFMFRKDSKYYFMWSEGGWTGPDYSVAYAIADSPLGPFKRIAKVLQQNPDVATGAGHHSVLEIPNKNEWYIVYHRRPLGRTDANHRVTCIDQMFFDEQGFIKPIQITHQGVDRPVVITPQSGRSAAFEKPYPRIAMLWAPTRGDSSPEAMAKHDLIMAGFGSLGLKFNRAPSGLAEGFTLKSIENARSRVTRLRELNPGVIILADVLFYEWPDDWLPEDHAWWLRKDGKRQQFWPGTHRMNWYDPEFRRQVVRHTVSLRQSGLDGVFYDNLREEPEPWVALLKEVRAEVGDDFLILANTGYSVGKHDFAAPFLNGLMYESGWSHGRTEWDDVIHKMQHSQTLLRNPRISLIERFEETRDRAGWPGDSKYGQKPEPDAAALRWSLAFALIVGDFYYLFSDNTSHRHDWHPEYDRKIGRPLSPGEHINSYVWQRRYEKGTIIVNLPGAIAPFTVRLTQPAINHFSGEQNSTFTIPSGDACILGNL